MSPAPRSPRLAALTQPWSSLIALPFAQTVRSQENAWRAMIVKWSSGLADGARRPRQKGRQVIAEANHPRLARLRAFLLRTAPRLGLRRREHDHGRFGVLRAALGRSGALGVLRAAFGRSGALGVLRAPLGRSGALGTVRPAVGAALVGGRRARARPLGGAMLGWRGATPAAPSIAGEVELGHFEIGHRRDRDVLADQFLDRRHRLAVLRRRQSEGAA